MAENVMDPGTDEVLLELSDSLAESFADFISSIEELARDDEDGSLVAMLLLDLSAVLLDGARLGALNDVVPQGQFEPDCEREPDIDRLRIPLHDRLHEIDEYTEIFDPYSGTRDIVAASLSDDLATIVDELRHGLTHYRQGRKIEALWWWQFSYITSWGPSASAALRAIQSLVAHVRLNAAMDA